LEQTNKTNEPEKAVLAGLAADSMDKREQSTEESLDELEAVDRLTITHGGNCSGGIQKHRLVTAIRPKRCLQRYVLL